MIRYIILDVDGTLTDSGIYYDNCGNELKRFSPVKGGYGAARDVIEHYMKSEGLWNDAADQFMR